MTTPRLVLFLICGFLAFPAAADDRFPLPPELQPDVDFWVDVFTEYSTSEGVLHDNRNLGVVYARLPMADNLSSRERQRRVDRYRNQIRDTLRTLANGKRDNLTAEEARVLALWPDDVTNATLSAAVGRIRYQHGLKERMRRGLERSGRWRDYINAEFRALNVPVEIAALPHVESSYNPDARSHVGASGIWQFTRSTGRRFMRVDHVVDERNDPFAATRAAGRLMAYNYSITGNWPMAITAYNHGLAGVRRAMRQHGDTAYVDILRNYKGRTFGFASRNFYVAFLAAMEVDQNVEKYFPGLAFESPVDYSVTVLPAYLVVEEFAATTGVSERRLAEYNPALQSTVWQGGKHLPRGYEMRIPSRLLPGTIDDAIAALPASAVRDKQLPDLYHTVSRGDTLSQIAETYDTRVSTLVALNNLSSSHRIRAGQRLHLPAAGPVPQPVVTATPDPAGRDVAEAEAVASVADERTAEVTEMIPGAMVEDFDSLRIRSLRTQTSLLSDPSDYTVAADKTIEVQPLETLGHYGEWLEIKTQRLRDINGLAFRTPVALGDRIKLDLGTVDAQLFEERRIAFHRAQQDSFFRDNVITGVTEHTIKSGESIWILSLREYNVPIWLFRQYNPNLGLHVIRPGTTVQFPLMSNQDSG